MAESKLRELSTDFAVKIIKLCDDIKGHYSIVNQLERSATSIGANIREANCAHGKPDFISKLQIALKECYETEYWLELFVKSEIINRENTIDLYNRCYIIGAALFAEYWLHLLILQKKIYKRKRLIQNQNPICPYNSITRLTPNLITDNIVL